MLLVLGAGGYLSRVGIDRDRRQSLHRPDVAQVSSEARLVDRQILVKRQQHRWNHTLWYEIGMAAHVSSPSALLFSQMTVNSCTHHRGIEKLTRSSDMLPLSG